MCLFRLLALLVVAITASCSPQVTDDDVVDACSGLVCTHFIGPGCFHELRDVALYAEGRGCAEELLALWRCPCNLTDCEPESLTYERCTDGVPPLGALAGLPCFESLDCAAGLVCTCEPISVAGGESCTNTCQLCDADGACYP